MFGRGKVPKSQQPEKTPYTIHNPHTRPLEERVWNENYLQIISIDPSIKNLGFRIERRYFDGRIQPIALSRTTFGTNAITTETAPNGTALTVNTLYRDVTTFFNTYNEYFPTTHILIMERQLPQNYKAVRISQHVLTEMMIRLANQPLLPLIVEVDSKLKSRQLGCPKGLNERQTKLWLIEKALLLSQQRGDDFSHDLISRSRKKDDLADVICQAEAWCSFVGLPCTVPVVKLNIQPKAQAASTDVVVRPILTVVTTPPLAQQGPPPPLSRQIIIRLQPDSGKG